MYPDHDCFEGPDFVGIDFSKHKTAVIFHDDFLQHKTGNHPESPQRLVVMKSAIEAHDVNEQVEWIEPGLCEEEDINRCHTRAHLETIKRTAEKASAENSLVWLDPDTPISPDSYRAARRAVGASMMGVDMILRDNYQNIWALCRPPGHHATPERAMGFCLFNNAACGAEYARAKYGIDRVMIIDYDLHHGNGTQDIFYNDSGVLYTSIHQSYHYPGTGHIDEIGSGDGRGFTVNFPVLAQSGDNEFALYAREIIAPIATQYKPQLLIASVGFDAHALDPLGYLQVSTQMFGKFVTLLRSIATELGIGILFTLEGGYSLEAQGEAIVQSLVMSTKNRFDTGDLPAPNRPSPGTLAAQDRLDKALKGIWNL